MELHTEFGESQCHKPRDDETVKTEAQRQGGQTIYDGCCQPTCQNVKMIGGGGTMRTVMAGEGDAEEGGEGRQRR